MRSSWLTRTSFAAVLIVGVFALSTAPPGGTGRGEAQSSSLAYAADSNQPWTEKVEAGLRALGEQAQSGSATVQTNAATRGVASVAGRLRVVVEAAGGNRAAAGAAIRDVGGQIEIEYADLIQALVPANRIPDLAADPRVRYVRTPHDAASCLACSSL